MSYSFLIVEDHLLFAEALAGLIEGMGEYRCSEILTKGNLLPDAVKKHNPDLIFLDLNLPDTNGITLISHLRQAEIQTPILVISMLVESLIVARAMDAGANGFVPKNTSMEELNAAILALISGKTFISAQLNMGQSSSETAEVNEDAKSALKELSARELEILTLIAKGLNNNEISEQLFISPLTVKTHRANIIRKLDLKNTAAIVHFASKLGII